MGAPTPDITALVNELALQHWTVANTPDLTGVIAAVNQQLGPLGGEINSALTAFANAQLDALFAAQEATETAHGGPGDTAAVAAAIATALEPWGISARYTTSSQVLPGAVATTIIDYTTVEYDSHSAVTTGASWKFTAPAPGKYLVAAIVGATAGGVSTYLRLFKNNLLYATLGPPTATNVHTGGSTVLSLDVGEFLDLRVTNFGGAVTLDGIASDNWVAISYQGP
jgi:hypothetical protein